MTPWALSNSVHSSLVQDLDGNGGGGAAISSGGVGKRWLHSLDHYRRLKDEDPIIPFSEAPIISKWGAISRASRTGYHTTDPVQATACQGSASTTPINFKGKSPNCFLQPTSIGRVLWLLPHYFFCIPVKDYNPQLDHSDYRWSSRGSDSSSHSSFLERYFTLFLFPSGL